MLSATPTQLLVLQQGLGQLAGRARAVGLSDQDMAEWLLSLSARWLRAHGVSAANVHTWLDAELRDGVQLQPLIAAAAASNDFGGRR